MTPVAIGRPLPPLTAETTHGPFDSEGFLTSNR